MKILRAIGSADPKLGGPIEGTLNSSKELIRQGHEVEIVTVDSHDAPFLADFPLPVHATGPAIGLYYYTPSYKKWLVENVDKYDCVIVQGIWRYISLAVRYACLKKNIPYFVFTHGMLDPWFKHQYPLKHLKKWLFWPWGDYRVLRDANAVLFTTEEERRLARQTFWLYSARERVVGYGIDGVPDGLHRQIKAFYDMVPAVREKPFLLFLSRIHKKKGCDLLIEAFSEIHARFPDWHLVMAGPDQTGWQSELEHMCEQKGVAHKVHWTGMISGDTKWGAFRAAEAFVLPSHSENFGIVVAEALSCGTPVLITDKVNIWREVKGSQAGLVDTDTLSGTFKLLHGFLTLSKKDQLAMGESGLECFILHFGVQQAAQNLIDAIGAPNTT